MIQKFKKIIENVQLWKGIAIVSGVFSLSVCILIIANYIQINRLDPVNTGVINTLVERLNQNPEDDALRQEIRELDFLARKAYFTNQWQIRTGGHLVLAGIAMLIISLQLINRASRKLPVVTPGKDEKTTLMQLKARKWVMISGSALVIIAFTLALLTNYKMKNAFTGAAVASTQTEQNIESEQTLADTLQSVQLSDSAINRESDSTSIQENVSVGEQKMIVQDQVSKTKSGIGYVPSAKEINNFPGFRGWNGNGIAYQKNIPLSWDGPSGNNILWKVAISLPGYNSPVVWGNKVFLAGANTTKREVYCYDLNTGRLLWTANTDNIQGSPLQVPDVTGDTGHSAPTVTTDGKSVYAIFSTGDIIAFDFNGKRLWARNLGLPQNHYGFSSSLIMYKNLLIVQYDQNKGAKVMALSSTTGETIWSTPRQVRVSWSSPILAKVGDHYELMLIADPLVASYDPQTGKELWSINCISGEVGPSLTYSDGVVYALNEYASLVAIKVGNPPQKLWEDSEYLSDVPSPVATDKYLFVVTSYGSIVCYDAKSGSKYWVKEFDNGFYSSPMIAEGNVFVLDKLGIMHIFKVDQQYVPVGESKLGEKTVTTPAFANGKILIRGDKNLYCIGK